jgi:uncharacterized coiled-coil protein SlyX
MPPKKQYPCGKCDASCLNGAKGDEHSAQCVLCQLWFHLKCIPGMNADFLENLLLAQDATGVCFWACKSCKASSALFLKKLKALEKRIEVLESTCLENMKTVERQNGTIADLNKKVAEGAEGVQRAKEDATAAVRAELSQLEDRKSNIVVYGLTESSSEDAEVRKTEDNNLVKELFDVIEAVNTKFNVKHRAGKRVADKIRPVIIICFVISFETPEVKETVLAKAKNLAGKEKFKKVFLAPDMTKRQREDEWDKEVQMREEVKQKNLEMTEEEKKESEWRLVGMRGKRRLVKWRKPQGREVTNLKVVEAVQGQDLVNH